MANFIDHIAPHLCNNEWGNVTKCSIANESYHKTPQLLNVRILKSTHDSQESISTDLN